MKYIFVTGGVVSSLGKGLAAASLGTLLEARGLKVLLQKFDPYLNVDPGTMSPYQHGEVYVLNDGAETDLDLGHYERFTSSQLSKLNNLTSGQVYQSVIEKERRGQYLGKTVQVIPHVTDEIKHRLRTVTTNTDADVIITEIGGTVGDIEGLPFLEAIRQFALEVGEENACFIHVTLIPYIKAAGELKTKPTQQSVAKLREIGISPDIVVCRSEREVEPDVRGKISLFCNIQRNAVIEFCDVDHSIYECPLALHTQGLDELVAKKLVLEEETPDLTAWRSFVHHVIHPSKRCRIAVVGKYIELMDAYKSIYESLTHAGAANDCKIKIVRVDAESIERDGAAAHLDDVHGILIPGGFGGRGIEGKISAIKYAREADKPFFGICLGMQLSCIEFARNVCNLAEADSTEFNPATEHPIVSLLEEQEQVTEMGGTMRLGSYPCQLQANTRVADLYGSLELQERHRHRYEFNQQYRKQLEDGGLAFSGLSPDGSLVEIIEIADHPFYIACQFHPEFQSKPNEPHPLFAGFVAAALEIKQALS